METLTLKVVPANEMNTKDFGTFLGPNVIKGNLPIPYYSDVLEGENLPFHCGDTVTIRTVSIKKWRKKINWLERHIEVTQTFIGLGNQPFVLVLGKPNHILGMDKPELSELKCLLFPPGHGIIMHLGTWHDFPLAYNRVTHCLIINSKQVIDTLASTLHPEPLNKGDIYKICIKDQFSVNINLCKGDVSGRTNTPRYNMHKKK